MLMRGQRSHRWEQYVDIYRCLECDIVVSAPSDTACPGGHKFWINPAPFDREGYTWGP
jgi:hypothetical protein